jgi:hypothetical protein
MNHGIKFWRRLYLLAPKTNGSHHTRRDENGAGGFVFTFGRPGARGVLLRRPASDLRLRITIRRPAARASHDGGGLRRRWGRVHVLRLGINRETAYFATTTRAFHDPSGGHEEAG